MLAAEVELDSTPEPSQADVLQQQLLAKQQAELEEYQRELEREARREAREMRRLEREVQQQQRQLARGQPEPLARVSGGSGGALVPGPALEVTVMRVVGCDLLTSGLTGRDFTVITYAGSRAGWSGRVGFKQCLRPLLSQGSERRPWIWRALQCNPWANKSASDNCTTLYCRRARRSHQDWQRWQRPRPAGGALACRGWPAADLHR